MTPIRLSELAGQLQAVLQQHFASRSFWVVADVSDHKFYPDKGTHYFDLVEKDKLSGRLIARMSAVSWTEGSKHIAAFEKSTGQKFTSGIQILCKVQVDFHISFGLKLQLVDIDVSFTLGELEKQKRETIERLLRECSEFIVKEGDQFITKNKGLKLPPVIQRIALIGSRQSAGYGDFMHTLTGNSFGYTFYLDTYHTQVQGENNAAALVEQLIKVFHSQQLYDVVVIMRGGGAETDFLLFNDFHLCKAIAKFPIPIITGIGHLKDQSIADLMANTETNAPTKAAAFIIAHNRKFEDTLIGLQKNMVIRVQQQLSKSKTGMHEMQQRLNTASRDLLDENQQELVHTRQQISHRATSLLNSNEKILIALLQQVKSESNYILSREKEKMVYYLDSLKTFPKRNLKNEQGIINLYRFTINTSSPENVLKRGFALVQKEGKIITSGEQLKPGDEIVVELHDTILITEIKEKKDGRKNDL